MAEKIAALALVGEDQIDMHRLWQFLQSKGNREILTWMGAGLVVLASGIWAVIVYFFPQERSTPEAKPTPNVEARQGGVAAGGNIEGSQIIVHSPAMEKDKPSGAATDADGRRDDDSQSNN